MKHINISVENSEYQVIESLKNNRKKRKKFKEIFIEGIESIKQASNAGLKFTRVIVNDDKKLSDWGSTFIKSHNNAVMVHMSDKLYNKLSDRNCPSEIIVTAKLPWFSLYDLNLPEKPFILIFDRPSDHGNFGSIVRSANSFNVDAIFVIGHGIDVYEPKVIRSSLGSIFHSKIIHIESINELKAWIDEQKALNGMKILGTDSTGEVKVHNTNLQRPISLILGNEAKGMSIKLQEECDSILSIPISGSVNSLNVSCAGSIFLWEVYRNQLLS